MTGRGATVRSIITLGGVVLAAVACTGQPGAPPVVSVADRPTPPPSIAAPEAAAPQAEGGNDADFDIPTAAPAPVWDETARRDAEAIATQAMTAFAQPDLAYEIWWATFGPLLSVAAQEAYGFVDPARIPAREVTGPAELLEETTPFLADVSVPTDVGTHVVLLSRDQDGAQWRVERLIPPEGIGS